MDKIVEEYFSPPAASGKHYRLLHLFPVRASEAVTGKNSPRYNYYSGGIGTGPWQLPLDESLEPIEGMNFDTIIIDSAEALTRIAPFARYRFLRGIAKALSSYARSLEYRLSAVYKSSTWKAMAPVRKAGAVLKKKAPAAPIPKRPPGIEGKDPLKKWRS